VERGGDFFLSIVVVFVVVVVVVVVVIVVVAALILNFRHSNVSPASRVPSARSDLPAEVLHNEALVLLRYDS
jgi:hypothetical protein